MTEKTFNLTAKCDKEFEVIEYIVYMELHEKINVKASKYYKNETDGSIIIELKKRNYGRWPRLFTNTDDEGIKPGRPLLWKEKFLQFEEEIYRWLEDAGTPDIEDDYEKMVMHALKRKPKPREQPEFKLEDGPELEVKDVTDEIKTGDITEQMRKQWKKGNLKDQLFNPSKFAGHFNVEEEAKR